MTSEGTEKSIYKQNQLSQLHCVSATWCSWIWAWIKVRFPVLFTGKGSKNHLKRKTQDRAMVNKLLPLSGVRVTKALGTPKPGVWGVPPPDAPNVEFPG